jgi:2-hydroxychromene-2-carboxylate isomerase
MPSPITFYFDVISGYSYVAWSQLPALAAKHKRSIDAQPVLFAGLLNRYGHKGPAEIPPKRLYTFRNCQRLAIQFDLPFTAPPHHPFNPLAALRLLSVTAPASMREGLIGSVFHAVWGSGEGVEDAGVLARLARAAGYSEEQIAEAGTTEVKARLRAQTDGAIARGAFGVPTFIVDNELFWGVDSLPHLDRFLAGEEKLASAPFEHWRNITPSATRTGA